MKKVIFAAAILIGCFCINPARAQVRISLNIGSQPEWGPTGYDHADYYYLPDIGVYYDVPAHQYIYRSNNVWVRRAYLPQRWSNYDLYHGYKVVLNEPSPWRHDADVRTKYAEYRGHHDQNVIRDNHEEKYRNHWHDNSRHEASRRHHGDRNHGRD